MDIKTVVALVKISRPIHWSKNLAIFAGIVFSGMLLEENLLLLTFYGFIIFSLATSSTYSLNDALDHKSDRLHPIKRKRPVASGELSVSSALIWSLVTALTALYLAWSLNYLFFLMVATYLILQILYSLYLKRVHILDILIIASGFVIRIYSGAFLINAHLSVWFLLCVLSVALFLASGKRRAELSVAEPAKTRKSLQRYPKDLLNAYVAMFGNAAWLSWALFTFFESPPSPTPVWLFLSQFSRTITVNKLLMVTIPVSIFAIMRYQGLIFQDKSEAPEKVFLTDIPLILSILVWGAGVIITLYGGARPSSLFQTLPPL